MVQGYTTIDQSKKLLSLGLDPSSADMCWIGIDDDEQFNGSWEVVPKNSSIIATDDKPISCWSLTALLELIPLYTLEQTTDDKVIAVSEYGQYSKCSEAWDNSIDAVFEMVCWLIEQGHIKVNK